MNHKQFVDNLGVRLESGTFAFEEQQKDLLKYLPKGRISILETGFNAGHSSNLFLEHNSKCLVYSYDLGKHEYVKKCASFLQKKFPSRLHVQYGDTQSTLRVTENAYDFAFIDGGHGYSVALWDTWVAYMSMKKGGIIAIDDVVNKPYDYNLGPNNSYELLQAVGYETLLKTEYAPGRGMVVMKCK